MCALHLMNSLHKTRILLIEIGLAAYSLLPHLDDSTIVVDLESESQELAGALEKINELHALLVKLEKNLSS